MIVVIFEAFPNAGKRESYFDFAKLLRPALEKIDGFISIERFQSVANEEKVLSLSFWRDEESVREWRNLEVHRMAQQEGRNSIFLNYRLRVAHVVRDYSLNDRMEAPNDSKQIHQ